jgi:predicted dehydrogenase
MTIERVLIVGGGSIGKRHFGIACQLLPGATVSMLTRNKDSDGYAVPQKNQLNFDEAVNFKPQIVVLANPSSKHLELADKFADVGAHLLIEKPLSDSRAGVLELIDKCELHSSNLLCGYNLRFLSSLQRFRHLVQSSEVGKVFSVQSRVGQNLAQWRPNFDYRKSVSAKRELGGGVLLELSHELDYLRWIFGDVEWVWGELSRQSFLQIDVEDSAQIILGFEEGVDGRKLIGNISLDFFRHDPLRDCTVVGELGSIRWNGILGIVEIWRQGDDAWKLESSFPGELEQSYVSEWLYFLHCIDAKELELTSGRDSFKVLEIIDAVRFSSEFGRKIFMYQMNKDDSE